MDLGSAIGDHEFRKSRGIESCGAHQRADDLSPRDVPELACSRHQVGYEQLETDIDRTRREHLHLNIRKRREIGSEVDALSGHLVRSIKYF